MEREYTGSSPVQNCPTLLYPTNTCTLDVRIKSASISFNLNTEKVLWWGFSCLGWFWVGGYFFFITSKTLNSFKCLKALETPNTLPFLLPCILEELCVFPKSYFEEESLTMKIFY